MKRGGVRGKARVHFRRARAQLRRSHVFPMNTSMCIWRTWAKSFHHVICVRATLTWDRLRSDQRRAPLRLGGDLNVAGHACFLSSADVPSGVFFLLFFFRESGHLLCLQSSFIFAATRVWTGDCGRLLPPASASQGAGDRACLPPQALGQHERPRCLICRGGCVCGRGCCDNHTH